MAAAVVAAALGAGAASARDDGPGSQPVGVRAVDSVDPNTVHATVPSISFLPSIALGTPQHGRLENGVELPATGPDWVTFDPILGKRPNREWRRWGTDTLIRTFIRVGGEFRAAHPGAQRLVVGDLSRTYGGDFGRRFGGIGHASHQNGLDIDIYYPRRDRALRPPRHVSQIDMVLAQDLVDRFRRAGAQFIFVGPSTGLRGPRSVVQPLINHDDHMHVRIHNPLGDAYEGG